MSDTNGFPEWLRELGAKVDKLADKVDQLSDTVGKLNTTVSVLHETAKHHEGMLGEIVVAFEHQRAINDEHRRELDEHAQRFETTDMLLKTAKRQQMVLDDVLIALRERQKRWERME